MRRVFVSGGELELARLLDVFPVGVEEVDGGFAVYTDDAGESALGELFEISSSSFAEGWEEAWREFHHGVVVGRFWVGPPWEQPTDGFTPIVIDPGRAFGTGAHATTRLSLDLLQELEPTSLLDVGCGSGVLSIAAAKLGFAPIIAVDNEQDAVEIADLNAHANGVSLTAYRADALVDDLPRADVVIANVALPAGIGSNAATARAGPPTCSSATRTPKCESQSSARRGRSGVCSFRRLRASMRSSRSLAAARRRQPTE